MKSFIWRFLSTRDDLAPFIARITLGLVMLPHGLQKTLGLFGGNGFSGTFGSFTGTLGIPAVLAVLVILSESLGSLGLIFGVAARFCAAGAMLVMLGAVQMVHWDNGFFMNWGGHQKGEGFEYHLLAIGLALSLVLTGAGRWSFDRLIASRCAKQK